MTYLDAMTAFIGYLRLRNYSPASLRVYRDQLKSFGTWLTAQSIHDLRAVTKAHLQQYQLHVRQEPIAPNTQSLRLRTVKRLFDGLIESGKLLVHPAESLQAIGRSKPLPRPVLTIGEMNRLLAAPNTSLALGIRDRALIEVLYATGLRVGELARMTVHHVDLEAQTLHVRHAKGGRPRVVPLGKQATQWLKEYLTQVRPRLVKRTPFERALFIKRGGKPLHRKPIGKLLDRYRKIARIKKSVTPHVLRHTCATHLLQQGADLRAIQQLLGHINLQTTLLYTRVAPIDVKATHGKYHPGNQESEHANR